MNFSQCYYTSINGWNAVGSPDLSPDAKTSFAAIQAANAPRNKHPLGPDGKPLHLYEVTSDGKNLFVTSCQYGSLDARGRPNMFAHGYCAEWTKELIADPAELCFIDCASFVSSKEQINFAAQPQVRPIHGFLPAMQAAGFAWQHFAMLTLAIYAVVERKDTPLLYLAASQEGAALQALMYAIYLSMPYSIRTKLSFATASVPGAKAKTVIFCKPDQVPAGALYFKLETGENNVVTQEWMKKNKKNQFMRKFGSLNGGDAAQQYFRQLDARMQLLGKQTSASYKLLYLADILMMMDMGQPLEADDLSLAHLMLNVSVNEAYVDDYLAAILDRLLDQEVPINDELNQLIWNRLHRTTNRRLMETRMRFRRRELLKMPEEKAAEELLDMKGHAFDGEQQKREFNEAQLFLMETDRGREVLGYAVRKDYLQLENKNFSRLADVDSDCRQLRCSPELSRQFVLEQAYELCCRLMMDGSALDAYQEYTAFLQKRFAPDVVAAGQLDAKKRYWDLFDLTAFSTSKGREYQTMMLKEHANCKKAISYAEILRQQQAGTDDTARIYLALLQRSLTQKEEEFLYRKCVEQCMAKNLRQVADFSAFIRLAQYAASERGESVTQNLVTFQLSGDVYLWQEILQNAPCFLTDGVWAEEKVECFVHQVESDAQNTDSELEKLLAEGVQSAYLTLMTKKKQLEKQALKAQKEELRQQRREQSGGSLGKLGSLMGRKKDSVQSENVGEIFEEETHLHQAPENQTPIYPYDHSSQSVRNESKRDELDSDVIYSGRDIAQMNQPVTQGYEPDDLTSKKKKMSDIFKWKK